MLEKILEKTETFINEMPPEQRRKLFSEILDGRKWTTAQGKELTPENMDDYHIKNCLRLIYKREAIRKASRKQARREFVRKEVQKMFRGAIEDSYEY